MRAPHLFGSNKPRALGTSQNITKFISYVKQTVYKPTDLSDPALAPAKITDN